MIKMVYCVRRLPHLSREEFQRYWRETHGPLVQKHAATLRIRRYVQVHTKLEQTQDTMRTRLGRPEPYDGIAELWWDNPEDLSPEVTTPERQQASEELFEDERRFVDHSRSPMWFAEDHVIIDG